MALNPKQLSALRWAVKEAATWRGTLTGIGDEYQLRQFDEKLALCRQALGELYTGEQSDQSN